MFTLTINKGREGMVNKMAKSKKDSITLTKNAFIGLILFVIAATIFAVYAYLGYVR